MIKSIFLLLASVLTLLAPPFPSSPWVLYSWGNSGSYRAASAWGFGGDLATFTFPFAEKKSRWPAFLTTTSDGFVLGDLTGCSIMATVSVSVTSGNPVWTWGGASSSWNSPGRCPVPANVRLYFSTNSATYDLASATRSENGYWWSHGGVVTISANTGTVTIADVFDPLHWSNANGHSAAESPAYTAAFNAAVACVRQIGLSFGGGCYFDVGVAIQSGTGGAAFHLVNFNVQ